MSHNVKLSSNLDGALGEPAGTGKVGAVVVLQEWHGLNDQMRGKVDRFAHEGYLAACPDLYHGKVADNDQDAATLMGGLDWQRAVADIGETVSFLKAQARSNGKVAVLGFCMGGALTLAAARHLSGLACAVPFYGVPQLPIEEYGKIKTPISAHFAKNDEWAKASIAEDIQKHVRAGGGSMDLYVYDAGHAFMRETDPSKYDAPSAKLAWERALAFLKSHLS
jgi:carboxymethylenebutenolidase